MKGLLLALLFTCCLTRLQAYDEAIWRTSPWFAPAFELQPSLLYAFQSYSSIKEGGGKCHRPSKDNFIYIHNSVTWMQSWQFSISYSLAQTSRYRFLHGNSFFLQARYLLLDDVVGDPVSLYIGLKAIQNSSQARSDPSILCHGSVGGELEVALGKEWTTLTDWVGRSWVRLAFGVADLGSPWVSALAAAERRLNFSWLLGASIEWLAGLGNQQMSCCNFRGYGSLRHRTVDLSAYLRAELPSQWGFLTGSYSYGCYAKNSPDQPQRIVISYLYPFGL